MTRSGDTTGVSTVAFATAGSAKFTSQTGTLVFAAGETSKTVVVDVRKKKRRKSFVELALSNASGATVSDGNGSCKVKKKKRRRSI